MCFISGFVFLKLSYYDFPGIRSIKTGVFQWFTNQEKKILIDNGIDIRTYEADSNLKTTYVPKTDFTSSEILAVGPTFYKDDNFGFQFEVPEGLTISTNESRPSYRAVRDRLRVYKGNNYFGLMIFGQGGEGFEEGQTLVATKNIEIGGIKTTQTIWQYPPDASGKVSLSSFINFEKEKNKGTYTFLLHYTSEDEKRITDEIISSFKFIK